MARIPSSLIAVAASVFAVPAIAQTAPKITDFKPVTEAVLENPDPGDWLMLSRTFDEQRFSPLKQINKDNVSQLRMAWTRGLGVGTQESTPIVHNGVMYFGTEGGQVYAVYAKTGRVKWQASTGGAQTSQPPGARLLTRPRYSRCVAASSK